MSKNNQSSKKNIKIVAIFVVGVLLVAFDLSPLGGANIRLYTKWAQCGQRPVQYSGHYVGQVPYYKEADAFAVLRGSGTKFFCTPLEAEQAGYSASPNRYEFPHLDKNK